MWILNKLPQVWHPFFRLDRFAARHRRRASCSASRPSDQRFDRRRDHASCSRTPARIAVEHCYLEPDPAQQDDAEVDRRRSSSSTHGVRADPVRDRREGAQLALERAALSTSSRTWTSSRSTSPTPRWTCSPTVARTAARSPGTVARGSLNADDDVLPRPRDDGQWTTGVPEATGCRRISRASTIAARRARPEPLQHLLLAVPRLRRPRPGRGPAAGRRSSAARGWRATSSSAGRRRRSTDAERPAVQHDLERLQHDDGLRARRSRTRIAGRSCSTSARSQRVAERLR